jgi:uncharacterized glyoxalase superfamily protein PhnB
MAHPSVTPALFYKDPRAAIAFLEKAFGFELDMMIEDESGALAHSQLRYGDGLIMVGVEWSANHQSPLSTGGRCTQTTHVYLTETTADALCARAEAAGAVIQQRPETQFYGDRTFRAVDPEGHIWTFAQPMKTVEPAEWDKQMGFKTWQREKGA